MEQRSSGNWPYQGPSPRRTSSASSPHLRDRKLDTRNLRSPPPGPGPASGSRRLKLGRGWDRTCCPSCRGSTRWSGSSDRFGGSRKPEKPVFILSHSGHCVCPGTWSLYSMGSNSNLSSFQFIDELLDLPRTLLILF